MSQVLWPISKVPLTKKPVFSCFSTATTTSRSKPYLLLGNYDNFYVRNKNNVLKFDFYDPTRNKEFVKKLEIQDDQSQTLRNLFKKSDKTIRSSRSYLVLRNRKDSSVNVIDISDHLNPKIISLPPFHHGDGDNGDEKYVENVSVSSPVINGGDFVVAVKFLGSRLSLCRVGDSEWTRIDVPYESFGLSNVIYSERDKRFYLKNDDEDCTGLIDFTPKSGLVTPPVIGYPFPINLEDYKKNVFTHPSSLLEEQIVESPSGQLFLVVWVTSDLNEKGEEILIGRHEMTVNIVVYKQDEEQENCSYTVTNDIGDLCIFLGEENEGFCVSASEYSGLKPNSVYFAHHRGVGIWDLSSQKVIYNYHPHHDYSPDFMCWIPPTPTPTPILTS